MLYPVEPRISDIIKRWNQADELYQNLREEAEEAIQRYDEMERMYEDASYDLHEAEDRITELEEEIRLLRVSVKQIVTWSDNALCRGDKKKQERR